MPQVPLFDVRPEHEAMSTELHAAFSRVVGHSSFILGAEVEAFETNAARYLGCPYAVGLSNGSDALYVALLALGIGPGCEVITSPFTFVATAEAILRCGATPVFADIDPEHFCLCPASAARLRTSKTRAVMSVHLYGHPGASLELSRYCAGENLAFIEDACQAFGARVGDRAAGTLGTVGVFSFFPTKPLGGFGDGGLLVTSNEDVAKAARGLRSHGAGNRGRYERLGGNFRLDALQAALIDVKLKHVDASRTARRKIAERYHVALANHRHIVPPSPPAVALESAWSLYTVRVPRHRDALVRHLANQGIESRAYYPTLLSEQPVFAGVARSDRLPNAVRASLEVLSLPIYAGLSPDAQTHVVEALRQFAPEEDARTKAMVTIELPSADRP